MAALSPSSTAALCNYECFIHKLAASFTHSAGSLPPLPCPTTPSAGEGGDYLQDSWVELYLQDINGHFWLLCKRAADKMFWDKSHVEQRLIRDDKLSEVFTAVPVIRVSDCMTLTTFVMFCQLAGNDLRLNLLYSHTVMLRSRRTKSCFVFSCLAP